MWNLLGQGAQPAIYKPSASSGTITNPTYAWDTDDYPWTTKATISKVGSAVAGTPDTTTYDFLTFPTLSKANFSAVTLSATFDVILSPVLQVEDRILTTGNMDIQYSLDGGSTWLPSTRYGTILTNGIVEVWYYGTAQDVAWPSGWSSIVTLLYKVKWQTSFISSSLTTGLQDVMVRFVAYTLTSTVAGVPIPRSSLSLGVWDIRAEVS